MEQYIDLKELVKLRAWYKEQPKLVQKASAMMLNNIGFGMRSAILKEINKTMIVRNPAFVSSRVKVSKTSTSTPIGRQLVLVGSVPIAEGTPKRGEFSGWAEQELGKTTLRNRVSLLASRAGDIRRKMLPSTRLKPGMKAVTISDYHPRGGDSNYGGFVAMLFRRKEKRLVRMGKGFFKVPAGGLPKTINKLKLTRVQELKKKQPHINHWLLNAQRDYMKPGRASGEFKNALDRLIKPPV